MCYALLSMKQWPMVGTMICLNTVSYFQTVTPNCLPIRSLCSGLRIWSVVNPHLTDAFTRRMMRPFNWV